MLSFLVSSTFFKYAQNEGFAIKKIKNFMGGHAPKPPLYVRTALWSSPVIPGPLYLHLDPDGYCL